MKPSPAFLLVLGILAVLFAPIYLSLQNEEAAHHEQAREASQGLAGYLTPEEEADKRQDDYMRKLGMSEERIQQERLIRSNERLAKAMQAATK